MSHLRKQLEKKQISSKERERNSKKDSLLFKGVSGQANDIGNDVILEIASVAFQSLKVKNLIFDRFSASLFSKSSLSIDRTLMTAAENEMLDADLNEFLLYLSPHFLDTNTFKVMEWLVRRFHIHEMNVDAIVNCILPFHETPQFVQVVSILKLGGPSSSKWAFLQSVQKSKTPLKRSIIMELAVKNASLLQFIIKMFTTSINANIKHTALMSFFCYGLIEYFSLITEITDNHLRLVLPVLLSGLKSSLKDYKAGMMILVSVIAKRAVLEQQLLTNLVENICLGSDVDTLFSCLVCFGQLIQNQKNFTVLSSRSILSLTAHASFTNVFLEFMAEYDCDLLVSCVCNSLLSLFLQPTHAAKIKPILISILQSTLLSLNIVQETITALLSTLMTFGSEESPIKQDVIDILQKIHGQRFHQVDHAVNTILSAQSTTKKQRAYLYTTISTIFNGSPSETIASTNTTLFLALQHPEVHIRRLAISRLHEILSNGSVSTDLKSFVEPVLFDRLKDKNDIVELVLALPGIENLLDRTRLAGELARLIEAGVGLAKAIHVSLLIVNRAVESPEQKTLVDALFGCLLHSVTSGCEWSVMEKLFAFCQINIKGLKKLFSNSDNADVESMAERNASVIQEIVSKVSSTTSSSSSFGLSFFQAGLKSDNIHMRVFCMLVLCGCIRRDPATPLSVFVDFADHLHASISKPSFTSVSIDEELLMQTKNFPNGPYLKQLKPASIQKFERTLIVISLACLIADCPKPKMPEWLGKTLPTSYENLIRKILLTIFALKKYQAVLISKLFEIHLTSKSLEFLFSCANASDLPPVLKMGALDMIAVYLETSLLQNPKDFQLLIPSILVCVHHEAPQVRSKALHLLKLIKACHDSLKGSKFTPAMIYGYDCFYGPLSSVLQYLEAEVASILFDLLIQKTEEMASDADYLDSNIQLFLLPFASTKGKQSNELLSFLISNILAMSHKNQQSVLLGMLQNVDSPLKLKSMVRKLELEIKDFHKFGKVDRTETVLLEKLVDCYGVKGIDNLLGRKGSGFFPLFISMISNYTSETEEFVFALALNQIEKSWYHSLALERQSMIFSCLIDALVCAPSSISREIKTCLQSIEFSAQMIKPKILQITSEIEGDEETKSKKLKAENDFESLQISKMNAVLEFLHFAIDIEKVLEIVPSIVLFLNCLLTMDDSSAEYPKQLILGTLEKIISNNEDAYELPDEAFRADLVVQCIRVTENPQTHNAALLFLSTIAKTHPDAVLMNIMPVFTFMGANILRNEDNYSFQVVKQTLETIIPSLISDGGEDPLVYIKNIMDVFVGALSHIPSHRRLKLFSILVKTLGEDKYLGSLVALIVTFPVISQEKPLAVVDDSINYRKLALQLCLQFPAEQSLLALESIMNILSVTPDEQAPQKVPSIFDVGVLQTKTIRKSKLQLLDFMNAYFKHALELFGLGHESDYRRTGLHRNIIKSSLLSISSCHEKLKSNPSAPFAKYLNISLKYLYDNMDSINYILSLPVFLQTVCSLLKDRDHVIKKRTIAILQDRIPTIGVDNLERDKFMDVLNAVTDILAKDQDSVENKQSALLCLSVIADHLGSSSVETYSNLFSIITEECGLSNADINIQATSMIAISSFVKVIGPRAVPGLSSFLPKILGLLESCAKGINETSLVVINSGFLALDSIFDSIPQFTSSYLNRIILLLVSSEEALADDAVKDNIRKLFSKMASKIQLRVIFPVVLGLLNQFISLGAFSLGQALNLMGELVLFSNQQNLVAFSKEWSNVFLLILDNSIKMKISSLESSALQEQVVALYVQFTLKLNEKTFKPLFMKTIDWGLPVKASIDSNRKVLMFKLINALLEKLKSIFVPYYSFILDHTIEVLESAKGQATSNLWKEAMQSLLYCLTYDNIEFIGQERFQKLFSPLVGQLERVVEHDQSYRDQMTTLVIPSIGQLANIRNLDESLKPLNKAICMKTRSENSNVRWSAVKALLELYLRLGEDMLVYFPETIPFMAELLEDQDPEVEALCKDLCLEIQNLLGEPIAPYFET